VKHHENEHVPSSGLVPVENREPRVLVHGLQAGVSSGYRTRTRVTRDGHTAGLAKPVACPRHNPHWATVSVGSRLHFQSHKDTGKGV
jgi:hypothetical protein